MASSTFQLLAVVDPEGENFVKRPPLRPSGVPRQCRTCGVGPVMVGFYCEDCYHDQRYPKLSKIGTAVGKHASEQRRGKRKLTDEQVRELRDRAMSVRVSEIPLLCQEYGIGLTTFYDVLNRRTYRDVR